jgi:hypothetical protein
MKTQGGAVAAFCITRHLRDEGDNFVYEAAFAVSPATIITHNLRDFRKPELDWPGVFVKTPQEVLKEMFGNA